jgi:hypothetical protein
VACISKACFGSRRQLGNDLWIGHGAAIDDLPYQVDPALLTLEQPRQPIRMADVVGLGKTIEMVILLTFYLQWRENGVRRTRPVGTSPREALDAWQLQSGVLAGEIDAPEESHPPLPPPQRFAPPLRATSRK